MLQFFLFFASSLQKYSTVGALPTDLGSTISRICGTSEVFEKNEDLDSPLIFVEKTREQEAPSYASKRCEIQEKFPELFFYKNKKNLKTNIVALDKNLIAKTSIAKRVFDKGYRINLFFSENANFFISNFHSNLQNFEQVSADTVPFGDIVNKSFDISVYSTENNEFLNQICPLYSKKKQIIIGFIIASVSVIALYIKTHKLFDTKSKFWVFDENDKVVFGGDFSKIDQFSERYLSYTKMRARELQKPVTTIIKIQRSEKHCGFIHCGSFPYKNYVICAIWSEEFKEGHIPKFKCTYESQTHGLLTPPQVTFSSYRDYRSIHISYILDNNMRCTADLPLTTITAFQPYGHLVVLVLSLFYDIVGRLSHYDDDVNLSDFATKNMESIDAKRVVIIQDNKIVANVKEEDAENVSDDVLLSFTNKVEPGRFMSFKGLIADNTNVFISRLKGVAYEMTFIVEMPQMEQEEIYNDYCLPFFSFCAKFALQVKYTKEQEERLKKYNELMKKGKTVSCEISMKNRKILLSSIEENNGKDFDEIIGIFEAAGFYKIRSVFEEIFDALKRGEQVRQKICIQENQDIWHSLSAVSSYDKTIQDNVATIICEEISEEKKQELLMIEMLHSAEEALNNQNFYQFYIENREIKMFTEDIFKLLQIDATPELKITSIVNKADKQIYQDLMDGKRVNIRLDGKDVTHTFYGICTGNSGYIICTDILSEISVSTQDMPAPSSTSTVVFWLVNTSDDTVHSLFNQPTIWDLVGAPADTHFSNFPDSIHPDDREAFTDGYSLVLNSQNLNNQWAGEIRIAKAGGDYEWHRIALAISEGGIVHCLAMNTNKKREAEFKLKETRQLHDILFSSGKLALWKFSDNEEETKLLHKFTPGVVMGVDMNWTFIKKQVPLGHRERVTKAIKGALESGRSIELDFPIILDANSSIEVSVRGKGDPTTRKVLGVCIDITELSDAYERLEKERKKAEEANKQKTLFLANMSHEIRTPMNGIFGMLDVLSLQELSSEQRLLVDSIRSSSFQLMKLLDDTLHLSKIEQGETEVEITNFSIWNLIEPTIIANYTTAKEKGVRLTLDVSAPFPSIVRADQQLFMKILNNLLSNAMKFTKQGHIDIRLSYLNGDIKLVVSDTGIGISKDQQQVIFERFQQADDAVARFFGGTGLGLALVREIAKFLGGDVSVESEVGKGSAFTVTIPIEDVMYPYRPAPKTRKLILIYIEDKIIQKQVITACSVLKYNVKVIAYPDEFQKNVTDETIALFYESSHDNGKMIRDIAERIGKVSVCSITDPGEACIFKYSIPRPAMFHHIVKFLDGLKNGVATNAPNIQIDAGTSRRCLVVEDNKTNQFVMKKMLQNLHCTLRIAENGAQAIDILNEEEFDIVFMDCQMPVLDGLEATRRIRKATDKKYHQIPIVALTASAVEGDEEVCMEAGMDAYLPKPVRLQQITEIIQRFSQH